VGAGTPQKTNDYIIAADQLIACFGAAPTGPGPDAAVLVHVRLALALLSARAADLVACLQLRL
jgi:hypothetical protein